MDEKTRDGYPGFSYFFNLPWVVKSRQAQRNMLRIQFWLQTMGEGPVYRDENLSVTAVATRHINNGERPSYAYIIECEGKRLIFTGDLHGGDAADFPAAAKAEPSDLIVCEMAHFSHEVAFGHLKDCPTRRVLFYHVWYNYEQSMASIEAAKGQYPFEVLAVSDGDDFEL